VTRLPYVPGSSLKGKLRSLLEMKYCEMSQSTGRVCSCGECVVCELFGCGSAQKAQSPGRLIFRDAQLSEKSEALLREALPDIFTEIKTEVVMDRRTGTVDQRGGGPRPQERVPQGTIFDLGLTMRLFEEDKNKKGEFCSKLAEAFEMLEKDYLGGSGTRGYGQVMVTTEDGQTPMADYIRGLA
jgi:CRISPR-associated protein Csm3